MIDHYDLDVVAPPCDPGSARLVVKARLTADITPVLPYLNATLAGAHYFPEARSLTWNDGVHAVAFHSYEIAVSDVDDRADAEQVIADLVDTVNRTWQGRAQIVPSVAAPPRPTPMTVYRLLPGTNCKDCGLPGCWQFALKLVVGEIGLQECPPLALPEHAGSLAELKELVPAASGGGR